MVSAARLLRRCLRKLVIFNDCAPCLGLGCVQEGVERKGESEFYFFLASRLLWFIYVDQGLIAMGVGEQALATDN